LIFCLGFPYPVEVSLYCHSRIAFALVLLAATTALSQVTSSAAFDAQTARGTVVSRLACLDDPAQSYALYLPSQYSPDRLWPILYAFDPFARGKIAVEVYQAAAEKYGYIVVGSNNSKNGPTAPQLAAAQAVWADTHRRFAIDKNRVYTTGLSGGARMATSFALYCYTCSVAGVIAHGAGYPVGQNPKADANDKFLYYAAVGDEDFNYPEIVTLRRKKDERDAPCKVKIYPGPHQWAPPEIAADAIEWLELKAMQNGTEKTDPAFVHRVFEQTKAEAAQAGQRSDALNEYYALRSLVSDFKGLKDVEVTEFQLKLAQLKDSKAFKNALRNEQREIDQQASLTATAGAELAQISVADPSAQAGLAQHIASVMSDLRRHGKSNGRDHLVYSRAFTELWIQGIETGQDEFRNNHLSQAATYFELMANVSPDQPWPLVLLAETRVRAGNKKAALKAIEEAVHRGLKRPQTLTEDPELQPLASDPDFQRIVAGLSSR
jgi:dienelactone hydrolase